MQAMPGISLFPGKVLSSSGALGQLPSEARAFGSRGVVVYGRALGQSGGLLARLAKAPGMEMLMHAHAGGEPTLAEAERLLALARAHRADWIAGVGGGSVMDLAKSAAGLFNAAMPLSAYHDGAALEKPGIPFLAAPTTAGTGSEATPNAVLTNTVTGRKKSIRDASLVARVALLDPDLAALCPRPVIAHSGMDAITQAVEAFTSRKATSLSDALCREGLRLLAGNLESFHAVPEGGAAGAMLCGSFMAGLGLAMARLGLVHGIAHPLGARFGVPHGHVCAVALPLALELNRPAIGAKYETLGSAVGCDIIEFVEGLIRRLGIKQPFRGKPIRDREAIVRETLASGSTAANPKSVERADVEWMLDRLFQPGR